MKLKKTLSMLILLFLSISSSIVNGQYFLVLPLPYPIDYLEILSQLELSELEEEEEIEEAPSTAFTRYVPADYKEQKALGYRHGQTFQVPEGLQAQVKFWKMVYHTYSVNEYVIHDSETMAIYRRVDISDINNKKMSYRSQRRLINQRLNHQKREIRKLLRSVHKKRGNLSAMNGEESYIYQLFKDRSERLKYLKATYRGRIRAQLGQREQFRQGLIWSGRYLNWMEGIFKKKGLPMELARLPFVESSFNLKARSKVGASGIWQFIRTTGRRFLKINKSVDERNDPVVATQAAAKLLKLNYTSLKSWPLAITAYNHGRGGMMRAVKKVKTNKLTGIIKRYRSRTFGFASKNFYASFLAALEVSLNYEQYYGPINAETPLEFDTVKLNRYVGLKTLSSYTNISKQVLKRFNPALTRHVFSGKKLIPKGYNLKIPKGEKEKFLISYHKIPKKYRRIRQKRRLYHKVRAGDTLYYLSRRYKTSVKAIRRSNNIGNDIYAGQVLIIPR